jgi:hypothetical protein
MNKTICSKCYFSKKTDDGGCLFGIPEIIKNSHSIEIEDDYFVLKNYSCRYGFSKTIYQENIEKFHGIDLIEYIKQKNIISYSLVFIIKTLKPQKIIDKINKLSILPSNIFIICYKDSDITIQLNKLLTNNIPYIKYKIFTFLDNSISEEHAIHSSLETNKDKIYPFIWILNDEDIDKCIKNDSIQNINYMLNVEQKPAHCYTNKFLNSNFFGLFINNENYWLLSQNEKHKIEYDENTIEINYD